ncbi:MAG TPA: hypothetical protein VEY07_09135 [Thermoplasmata archaeon]|nr:hypothetical protein [Thermoplasmata archaeon]
MSPSFEVVEVSLRLWDDHISRCSECLVEGQHLCYEGEYLTEKVVAARVAARLATERADRMILPSQVRATLPGVVA